MRYPVCGGINALLMPAYPDAMIMENVRRAEWVRKAASTVANKRLLQVDVFTRRRFGGNQLAIVLDAEGLSDAEMQAIAREMNYSETTFVLPAQTPEALCRVRIFTPVAELPFAGHPVVGTAWVLAREGRLPLAPLGKDQPNSDTMIDIPADQAGNQTFVGRATLQLKIGPLAVVVLGTAPDQPAFVWMDQPLPESRPWRGDVDSLLAALGLAPGDLDPRLGITWASAGVPYVYVPVRDRAAVGRAVPGSGLRAALAASGADEPGAYVFSIDDATSDRAATHGRMFAPHLGVLEDAATGSAAGPLGVILARAGILQPEAPATPTADMPTVATLLAEQGVEMGRPSLLTVQVMTRGDTVERVRVGGPSVLVAEGRLVLADEPRN